jgi:hypothetical protein
MRRLTDLVPSRRDLLRWGGVALAGSLGGRPRVAARHPRASGAAVTPRGTAKNVIFIELGGAIGPMDCWDFKETRWTPQDLDVTEVSKGLLSPRFSTALKEMHRVGLVRSMQAPELIHFNGQYTQAGRASIRPSRARFPRSGRSWPSNSRSSAASATLSPPT